MDYGHSHITTGASVNSSALRPQFWLLSDLCISTIIILPSLPPAIFTGHHLIYCIPSSLLVHIISKDRKALYFWSVTVLKVHKAYVLMFKLIPLTHSSQVFYFFKTLLPLIVCYQTFRVVLYIYLRYICSA